MHERVHALRFKNGLYIIIYCSTAMEVQIRNLTYQEKQTKKFIYIRKSKFLNEKQFWNYQQISEVCGILEKYQTDVTNHNKEIQILAAY